MSAERQEGTVCPQMWRADTRCKDHGRLACERDNYNANPLHVAPKPAQIMLFVTRRSFLSRGNRVFSRRCCAPGESGRGGPRTMSAERQGDTVCPQRWRADTRCKDHGRLACERDNYNANPLHVAPKPTQIVLFVTRAKFSQQRELGL